MLDPSQCSCPEPSCPSKVPTAALCFYTRDPVDPEGCADMDRSDGLGGEPSEAELLVSAFAKKLNEAEEILSALTFLHVEDHTHGASVVGRAGIKLGEAREQLPAMREVARDGGRA
jgi:hypothetical protein